LAVNHLPSHHLAALTPSELDRLNGKTHLVVDAGNKDAGDSGPSDSITHIYTHWQGSIERDIVANKDNLHPIITQDIRSFEMDMEASTFDTSFFDFPMASQPVFSMPDLHGTNPHLMVNDAIFPHLTMNLGFEQQQQQQQYMPPLSLDGTWESFVGQLGL
jgi:hypothetical protein